MRVASVNLCWRRALGKVAIDAWTAAAGLSEGPLFRRVRRRKYPEKTPAALSERMIWHIVTKYARQTGLVDKLAPHDMRRTCAKLCRDSGGDLEQIQFCWAMPPSRPRKDTWDRARI
jgi:integrase